MVPGAHADRDQRLAAAVLKQRLARRQIGRRGVVLELDLDTPERRDRLRG
jgi:hypothetical protein